MDKSLSKEVLTGVQRRCTVDIVQCMSPVTLTIPVARL